MNNKDKIIFIVGCGRSGTTLLKSLLGAHEDIHFVPETFFYTSVVKPGPARNRLEYVCSRWWIRSAGVRSSDVAAIIEKRGLDPDSWDDIFFSLLISQQSNHKSKFVGEKTPSHYSVIPHLLEAFPGALVIQMMRDPRAVLFSYRKASVGTKFISPIVQQWRESEHMSEKMKNNRKYMKLHYEDLVLNPRGSLVLVCEFLSIPFSEGMLSFYRRKSKGFAPEQAHHENTMRPIFSNSLESWKGGLGKLSVGVVEASLKVEMTRQGYLVQSQFSERSSNFYLAFSAAGEFFHMHFVRRISQRLKMLRANIRFLLNDNEA